MKFIYFIIIGLMLFNGLLIVTAPMFNSGLEGSATNVTDEYGEYGIADTSPASMISNIIFSGPALATWSIFGGIAILGALVLKNYVVVAVAIFLGLVTSLYTGVASVIVNIYHNVYFDSIITLIGVVIGILVIYNVIEMFSGTAGDV